MRVKSKTDQKPTIVEPAAHPTTKTRKIRKTFQANQLRGPKQLEGPRSSQPRLFCVDLFAGGTAHAAVAARLASRGEGGKMKIEDASFNGRAKGGRFC